MNELLSILPDLIRGSTTTIALLILLPILSKTRIRVMNHFLYGSLLVSVDMAICAQFYYTENYTAVVYYSLVFYGLVIVGLKYLMKDHLLQWLFNCVTVLNVYVMIVISSYYLGDFFTQPEYANTVLRLFLFAIAIVFFKKKLRPLYLEVFENWGAFLLPTTGLLISYLYILLSLGDVRSSMDQNWIYFCLLTVVTILSYTAIILSLKNLRGKFLLREDNIKRQANEALLESEILAYESTLNAAKQTRHDVRHHNAIVIEYLNSNDLQGAKEYLQLYDDHIQETAYKEYSKNPLTNAVFRIYHRRAKASGVDLKVDAVADGLLKNKLPDMGILLSNLLENALAACKECNPEDRFISYTSSVQNDSILIEIRNSVEGIVEFENGLPVTTKPGGGTGLISVKNIVMLNHGMMQLRQDEHTFITQIIFPTL